MPKKNHNKKLYIIIAITLFTYILVCVVTYDPSLKMPLYSSAGNIFTENQQENTKENNIDNIFNLTEILNQTSTLSIMDEPTIEARNAIVLDNATGRSLYKKKPYEKVAMASTTKIMTFLIVAENCSIYEETKVSKSSSSIGGSTMNLKAGEKISVEALLYGLLLNSGNDAACALAEHTAGSIENFCKLMNEKARILGAFDTHFTSPHGLDDDNHYTTCYDLALIAKAAVSIPLFVKIISTKQITLSGHYLTNTNPLLEKYDEVVGGKTGYTSKADRCLMLYIKNDNVSAIIILLGSPSSASRISDGAFLTKYISKCFKTFTLETKGSIVNPIKVSKGNLTHVNNIISENITLTLSANDLLSLEYTSYVNEKKLVAPVHTNEVFASICIYSKDELLAKVNCIPSSNVLRKTYTDHLSDIIRAFPYVFT